MKTCIKCNVEKELSSFRFYRDKFINTCRKCESERASNWKKNNPEKVKEYKLARLEIENSRKKDRYKSDVNYRESLLSKSRNEYSKRPFKKLIAGAKRRAELSNVPFDLEESDILIPEYCPVFGVKLEHSKGQPSDNSPSLDRIIPELGYVKGNIQVISYLANRMKSSATPEQLKIFAEWILENYEQFKVSNGFVTSDIKTTTD